MRYLKFNLPKVLNLRKVWICIEYYGMTRKKEGFCAVRQFVSSHLVLKWLRVLVSCFLTVPCEYNGFFATLWMTEIVYRFSKNFVLVIDILGRVLCSKVVYIISFSLKIVANSSLLFSNHSLQCPNIVKVVFDFVTFMRYILTIIYYW